MKAKEPKKQNMVKVPESALLSLVAAKLKNRNLFPEKVEDTKKYIKDLKVIRD